MTRKRAERARASIFSVDFGVGIESSLLDIFDVEIDMKVCSIYEGHGTRSELSRISKFGRMLDQITAGREVDLFIEQHSDNSA